MSKKTPNDATLQSTKQMLDELDALMEKMLSLPVTDADEAPPFPQEEVVKSQTLAATLTLLEPPAPESAPPAPGYQLPATEPAAAPLPFNPPHMALPASRPVKPSPPQVVPPPPAPAPLTNEVLPPSVMPKLEPLLSEIPGPAAAARGMLLGYGTLVWINQAFDSCTLIFGNAGHWLRSQAGRTALGISGIALMLAATGWFIKDWLGWHW